MALLPKNFLAAKQRDVTGDMHGQALGLWYGTCTITIRCVFRNAIFMILVTN